MIRFLKKATLAIFICSLAVLQGCFLINGPTEFADEKSSPELNYLPIGIPFLLGGHGSSVPITPKLSITAAHVARYDYSEVVAYHPYCDVAIIQSSNIDKRLPMLGRVYQNQTLDVFGFGLTGKVITSSGKYYLDVNFLDSKLFQRCPASITDAAIQSGMSGGGVFNDSGELVGVISGMSGSGFKLLNQPSLGNKRTTVFVSTLYIQEWLQQAVNSYHGYDVVLYSESSAAETLATNPPQR
ncbi:S1 family peptidase [Veronia pacifica]|uniref:Serine protease n=1 Tax=Veronia pacifica TaxID=1080227 RepID=A0A1C3ERE7_9GAMM|nr:serine protease [Veronia pacifica]ODA35778.1 hypothetical protein A8L45_01695 [Veronia pacifica]